MEWRTHDKISFIVIGMISLLGNKVQSKLPWGWNMLFWVPRDRPSSCFTNKNMSKKSSLIFLAIIYDNIKYISYSGAMDLETTKRAGAI